MKGSVVISLFLLLWSLALQQLMGVQEAKREVYVIYMGAVPVDSSGDMLRENHLQLLSSVLRRFKCHLLLYSSEPTGNEPHSTDMASPASLRDCPRKKPSPSARRQGWFRCSSTLSTSFTPPDHGTSCDKHPWRPTRSRMRKQLLRLRPPTPS
ncbi:hypothetical protein BHE74_00058959 [Ensete ventricosum]|nr:hypothetical protein BHE74_00058959 [Ensete ventricosum]